MKNFTIHIEWDGGGEEALFNPEWRMKGDAPDKQGRVSHRDAKVNRVNPYSESLDMFSHLLRANQAVCAMCVLVVSLCNS